MGAPSHPWHHALPTPSLSSSTESRGALGIFSVGDKWPWSEATQSERCPVLAPGTPLPEAKSMSQKLCPSGVRGTRASLAEGLPAWHPFHPAR